MFLPYTVQDARTVHYLGLYISMDSLTLTLASFSQRYLAETQDDINILLEENIFVFIGIRVECLQTFYSVLFGFRKYNKINYIAYPLRIPGISVISTTGISFFFFFLSIDPIKIYASFGSSNVSLCRWNLKMSEFHSPYNWYSTAIG